VRLQIRHRTIYRFERPVFLESHVIRLRPRVDASIWPVALQLDIDPAPAIRAENLDPEGNVVTQAWFEGLTDHLSIDVRSTVDTMVTDPFHFLLESSDGRLPFVYDASLADRLLAYLGGPLPESVQELAGAAATDAGEDQGRFPMALAARIHRDFKVEYRESGHPRRPDETAVLGTGACRDLACLFMACCRSVGLASRFVSGYAHVDGNTDAELHAWAEVYMPGGGWRGYDPTLGLVVSDLHVPVAAAARPEDAAPVSGTYRGDASSKLETVVEVSAP
jgi:transglutaminase-like putative cysteine protease